MRAGSGDVRGWRRWAGSRALIAPVLIALLLGAGRAGAEGEAIGWEDPSLEDAVQAASLIVLAEAEGVGKHGVAYRVQRTLKGPERRGDLLAVTGLHHPDLRERPAIEVGDRAYLLLVGEPTGEGFAVPTPTFGRFPLLAVREGGADPESGGGGEPSVVASLGGIETFVRLAVPPGRFEELVRGIGRGGSPRLMAGARGVLSERGADPEALYLALWDVALLGHALDPESREGARKTVLRLLDDPRLSAAELVRVRMAAANALGRLGGPDALTRLLQLAGDDPHPAVRSLATAAAVDAVRTAGPDVVERAAERLASLASGADARPVRFAGAEDPRSNQLPSPFAAALVGAGQLGSAAGVGTALAALEGEDLDAIEAALEHFVALGDPARVSAVAERMRPAGSKDAFVNARFGRALEDLTGARLGVDRDAWLRWAKEQPATELGPAGPPLPPGGDEGR